MIGHNHPSAFYLAKQKIVMPAQITNAPFKHPFANNIKIVRRKIFHHQYIERKFAHGRCIGVAFFVIAQGFLPSPFNAVLADEHQGVALPIRLHKPLQIAAVPGFCLCSKKISYLRLFVRLSKNRDGQKQKKAEQTILHGVVL